MLPHLSPTNHTLFQHQRPRLIILINLECLQMMNIVIHVNYSLGSTKNCEWQNGPQIP